MGLLLKVKNEFGELAQVKLEVLIKKVITIRFLVSKLAFYLVELFIDQKFYSLCGNSGKRGGQNIWITSDSNEI